MTVGFNPQQSKAISEYRQKHNLGYTISDEQVVSEMRKNGKLPACFQSLNTPVEKSLHQKQNN